MGGAVDQGNPAHLHIVFRRYDNLRFSMDTVINAVEDGPVKGKGSGIPFNLPADRMISGGPETLRIGLMDIAEGSPAVTGRIRTPAGKFPVPPLAVAAAAVGDHQPVAAVAEQQTPGRGGMGSGKGASRRGSQVSTRRRRLIRPRRDQVQRRQGRYALLEQGLKGTHPRVAVKPARERVAVEEVGQRQKRHPLVMGHIGLDYHPAFESMPPGYTPRLPAEIHGLVIAVIAKQPQPGQVFQIQHGRIRRHVQCQEGGIGSDDQLFLQTSLQTESRNAEGLVLIGLVEVQIGIGRL